MQDSIEQYMQNVGKQARQAASVLAGASTLVKNNALSAIYTALENSEPQILAAKIAASRISDLDSGKP